MPKKPASTPPKSADKPARARASLPDHVVLELWARAAGLCQYRGCTKPLYLEDLTKARLNRSNIAHIVGASERGPRGDARSESLETDIDNLMLACRDHHWLCDLQGSPEGEKRHTEDELQAMKREREEFIAHALKMIPTHETNVLTVFGRISGNPTSITKQQIREALWERQLLPTNDEPIKIDVMGKVETDDLDQAGWAGVRLQAERRIDRFLDDVNPSHVSVFALARIPLLVAVGFKLGDKVQVQAFQPTDGSFVWPDPSATDGFDVIGPDEPITGQDVVLKLEVSGVIGEQAMPTDIPTDAPTISIRFAQPRARSVRSPRQILAFAEKVRQVFEHYGFSGQSGVRVHVLPAVPCAVAVEFGRCLRQHHARTSLYEWRNDQWLPTFDITS